MKKVRLLELAHARSGDKGDGCNIGVIARKPEYFTILKEQLTVERLAAHFKGWVFGAIKRYELPNIHCLNFLLEDALGGGATESLRTDNQGKAMNAALLRMEVEVPDQLAV